MTARQAIVEEIHKLQEVLAILDEGNDNPNAPSKYLEFDPPVSQWVITEGSNPESRFGSVAEKMAYIRSFRGNR